MLRSSGDSRRLVACITAIAGSQYAAQDYREALLRHSLIRSMGRRGNPYGNPKAESFIKTLKVEAVYPMAYQTFADVTATFRDSSTRSTTAAVSTPLSAISARNSSRTATPGPGSNPQPDQSPPRGPTPSGGTFPRRITPRACQTALTDRQRPPERAIQRKAFRNRRLLVRGSRLACATRHKNLKPFPLVARSGSQSTDNLQKSDLRASGNPPFLKSSPRPRLLLLTLLWPPSESSFSAQAIDLAVDPADESILLVRRWWR
jgi:hypothetical protein